MEFGTRDDLLAWNRGASNGIDGGPRSVVVEGDGECAAADSVGNGVLLIVEASTVSIADNVFAFCDVVEGDAIVLIDLRDGDVSAREIIWENSTGPQALWVGAGSVGNHFLKEVRCANKLRRVGFLDVVVGWARPVAVPRCLKSTAAPGACLESHVVWMSPHVWPSRADDCTLKGAGELPLVLVAKALADCVGDVE